MTKKRSDGTKRGGREQRRLGFAVKVLGRGGMRSSDTRRWQSEPSIAVSIEALEAIIGYLGDEGIRMYRISSDFVPYATHPDLPQFHGQIEAHAASLARVGEQARRGDVRLSLHPSQYVVLNAEDPSIVEKAVADLESQAELLDALGQGPDAVVVLHVGGVYGDKPAALARFIRNVDLLSDAARRRLVVENDESAYDVTDCLRVHEATGLRVVFDHQHHRLNPGGLDTVDAARRALATWPRGQTPKVHFSSPRLDGREVKRAGKRVMRAPLLRQHADYVDPWTFADFLDALADVRFDVMLEAKAKDLALLRLRADLDLIGRSAALTQPAARG